MRLRILSDLHREFGTIPLPDISADVVILAGDIDRGTRGVTWARQHFADTPVLYVVGNHEHYDERIGRLHEKVREAAAGSTVHILENETVSISGVHFFGATLWSDFLLFGDRIPAMAAAADRTTGLNDYRKIRRADTARLRPVDTAALHADSRLALNRFLASHDRTRAVVITHHAPSHRSLPEDRKNTLVSAAYASDLDAYLRTEGPALWVHGHIHTAVDYHVGTTRIVANPLGYQTPHHPERTGFIPDLVIEV